MKPTFRHVWTNARKTAAAAGAAAAPVPPPGSAPVIYRRAHTPRSLLLEAASSSRRGAVDAEQDGPRRATTSFIYGGRHAPPQPTQSCSSRRFGTTDSGNSQASRKRGSPSSGRSSSASTSTKNHRSTGGLLKSLAPTASIGSVRGKNSLLGRAKNDFKASSQQGVDGRAPPPPVAAAGGGGESAAGAEGGSAADGGGQEKEGSTEPRGGGEEKTHHPLPDNWDEVVADMSLRTNFSPAELEDLFQVFMSIAGEKSYMDPAEFRTTVRRNFGLMSQEWITRYFKAFDRNHSGTIDFPEYAQGFAGMARVLTDKKAQSLIGLSTGSNIIRSGRNARLHWDDRPQRVAVVKKWKNKEVAEQTEALVRWLQDEQGLEVLIDPSEDSVVPEADRFMPDVKRFRPDNLCEEVDFIITLGGDGTVLKVASYFNDSDPIPPTLAFSMGSLGFLAPFAMADHKGLITRVLEANKVPMSVTLRTRLRGEVYHQSGEQSSCFYCLNEFIVNRGLSGVLSTLEVYVDGQLVTTAQGDGLIVATPSGSTAYNISAGGCMVSPLVPATLITPIAPHSLSFRPILTSASSEITVRIPKSARADGWMSFDATESVLMGRGGFVKLCTASMPMPTINATDLDGDWFNSISSKLHWNLRSIQKPMEM